MKATFPISELEYRNSNTVEEQTRSRKIFEALKLKAREDKFLSEYEKDFFCSGLRFSSMNNGKLEDYNCCDNSKFKLLYLTYYHDLTGISSAYKINNNLRKFVEIDNIEKQENINYLYEKSTEWEKIINKSNHKEDLLQQVSTEARTEIKELNKKFGISNLSQEVGNFKYRYSKEEILLKLKFIYCLTLKYFEKTKKEDLLLELNCQQYEINEYSIIHILNRHFASISHNTSKSFHTENFSPEILDIQLKEIFEVIDNSKILFGHFIEKLAFRYNQIDYQIWTSEKTRYIAGKKILFRRIDTFYPVFYNEEKEDLKLNYDLIKISDNLFVYLAKLLTPAD